jgi:hypothetical protein
MSLATLFEMMLIYHNVVSHTVKIPGLEFALANHKYQSVAFDVVLTTLKLIFDIRETSTKLTGTIIYKTGFINDDVAAELLETFYNTVNGVLLDPNRKITTLGRAV